LLNREEFNLSRRGHTCTVEWQNRRSISVLSAEIVKNKSVYGNLCQRPRSRTIGCGKKCHDAPTTCRSVFSLSLQRLSNIRILAASRNGQGIPVHNLLEAFEHGRLCDYPSVGIGRQVIKPDQESNSYLLAELHSVESLSLTCRTERDTLLNGCVITEGVMSQSLTLRLCTNQYLLPLFILGARGTARCRVSVLAAMWR
jgi:hypothetical protein